MSKVTQRVRRRAKTHQPFLIEMALMLSMPHRELSILKVLKKMHTTNLCHLWGADNTFVQYFLSLKHHSVISLNYKLNFWLVNFLMVNSISGHSFEMEILCNFQLHSSWNIEIYCYSQGVHFLLDASEMSQYIQYTLKRDITKLKCIQKKWPE